MKECTHLEHIVGNGEVKPYKSKVRAIAEFPLLTTKKPVRSFLGLMGYYRHFIPNYVTIATPLTNLTRKSVPERVSLSTEGIKSFSKLKEIILSYAILKNPDSILLNLLFYRQTPLR